MSKKEDPANLVIAVVIAIAGLFACLIISAVVVDFGGIIQNSEENRENQL